MSSDQSLLAHQACHTFTSTDSALIMQFGVHTWASLSSLMLFKHGFHLFGEFGIFSIMSACGAFAPGVIPAHRDLEHATHERNWMLMLVFFNKLIFHC
jgi:hypothetical protein